MAATDVLATGASVGPSATPQISALLGVTYACHLDQPDSDLWFSSSHASTSQKDTSACNGDSLSDRYAECLWLGEHHTGLGHFLECIDRLHLSHELDDIVLGLCQLIKSRSAITRRHRAVADNLLKASESTCHDSNLEALSNYEIDLGRRAVERAVPRSKPREAVDAELGSLRERWTSSMESREIQLQILVTLSLLQIVSQEPKALETARSRMSLPSATSNAPAADIDAGKSGKEQPRKRSRKLEKAKRWRGTRPQGDVEDAFAWNSQVRRRHTSEWSHDEADRAEADVLEMQGGEVLAMDHLSKRLEALVDILCLRQVASGIDTELESLLNDSSDAVKTEHAGGNGGRGVLLGSSVRKLVEEDELDDAQWLCSCVVEPHFEASLPRQCSLFRSKCFVSLQSRTPARPTKVARTGSLGSPTMRSTGSLAPSRSPPNGGLSRVLEKELAGRKARRNPMTKRSMVLGQGREVDMGRRLARSVSVTLDREKSTRSGSVFSRSSNASTLDESSGASLKERSASVYASGALGGKAGMALSQSFAASSQSSGRRLLVLSTPQKEPASRVMGPTHHHFSQMDKPKLVFPSLVLESPTHDGLSVPRGATGRFAERSLSFNALGDLRVPRSPSPDER